MPLDKLFGLDELAHQRLDPLSCLCLAVLFVASHQEAITTTTMMFFSPR